MNGLSLPLLGSGEFEPWTEAVDRSLLQSAGRGAGRVLILPTASAPEGDAVFDAWGTKGLAHYEHLGFEAEVLPLKTRADAEDPAFSAALESASLVYFSGGNPAYLARTLADTPFWLALRRGLDDGLAYAGCSAGAACLGHQAPDSAADLTGNVWQPGLSLLPGTYVGPHWNMLDSYIPGLRDFFISSVPKDCRLLAIDESTALVGDGNTWTVFGSGNVGIYGENRWLEFASGASFAMALLSPAGQ